MSAPRARQEERFERDAVVRRKVNANHWGGKPGFDTVTLRFAPDAAARVAEVKAGSPHVAPKMPHEEYVAHDVAITLPCDKSQAGNLLAASCQGPDHPVRFRILTARGFKPKDDEMARDPFRAVCRPSGPKRPSRARGLAAVRAVSNAAAQKQGAAQAETLAAWARVPSE